ncbi:hypothetical protein NEIG_01613 [Nematocida sp. ERTm5]|nr:hypothetical protein NEIG_01613 [Nematocida sp. ERTm5]
MKISKIIIIKRKAIMLVIWYMWVRASNEEDLYILNGMDDSINNNCTSADIYNHVQPDQFINNFNECLIDEEQLYNPYNIQCISLNSSSALIENLPDVPNLNTLSTCPTDDSYSNGYCILDDMQTHNPCNAQYTTLNNVPYGKNVTETETLSIFTPHPTSIDYNQDASSLFELNSSEPQKIHEIGENQKSAHASTSTNRKRNNQNHKNIEPSTHTNSNNSNDGNELSQTPFVTSSIIDLDGYKNAVAQLHNYKLEFTEDEQKKEKLSCRLYLNAKEYDEAKYIKFKADIGDITKKYKDIWMALHKLKKETTYKILEYIGYIGKYKILENDLFKDCNLSYYPGILSDISKICKSSYSITKRAFKKRTPKNKLTNKSESDSKKSKVESDRNIITLGNIYAKRKINLLWHAESMLTLCNNRILQSSFVCAKDTANDLNLQRQLLLILCLPEIYEDLFYMEYEEIDLLRKKNHGQPS